MITIEQAITQLLLGDQDVSALVSDRIYPQVGPQEVQPPCVIYTTSEAERTAALNGYLGQRSCVFRFDCYGGQSGGSYASAKTLGAAVQDCLFGFLRGELSYAGETLEVQGILDEGGSDELEPPIHGEERGLDYCAVSVRVWWHT